MTLAQSVRAAARTIATDAVTAEVTRALRDVGIASVILRGPAVARRLFDESELRTYVDVDVLVSPDASDRAGGVLADLGFAPVATSDDLPGHRPLHAHEWRRAADRISVDLHQTISGARAPGTDVWRVIAAASEPALLAGEEVELPGDAALALIVTLHAAHNGPRGEKQLDDLLRALRLFGFEVWLEASELAARVDATAAFVAGLGLMPDGVQLARRLGLSATLPVEVSLRAAGAPPLALGLDWWTRQAGVRKRVALALHVLLPPPNALRAWRPLARRGPSGVAAAYVSHPFWLARHSVPSLLALRRARKATG